VSQFAQLGLSQPILKALAAENYETPTPIQAKAIPAVMAGHDIVGLAQTGTGKTAAFALPILHALSEDRRKLQAYSARALVLSPTRELASQIEESFRTYGRFLRLTSAVVFGGVPINRQRRVLQPGIDILVATPGRLLDLVDQRALRLDEVEMLVLDEADQMMDLGFIHALRRIAKLVPRDRQSLFFSATMPPAIRTLAQQFLADPVEVTVAPVASTAERVEQRVIHTSKQEKPALLAEILSDPAHGRTIVFSRTKHGADKVVRGLAAQGIASAAIHGNKSQAHRERALGAFRSGACPVLVATDIAARGIDVEAVGLVVNFDLPNVPETYVHRIGRTARAGAEGLAISFCDAEERAYLRSIERLTRKTIKTVQITVDPARQAVAARPLPRQPEPEQRPRPAQRPAGAGEGARPPRNGQQQHRRRRRFGKPQSGGKPQAPANRDARRGGQ